MLELLAKRLDEAGVSHFTLQGSTPKPVRAEQVRRFNQGEADVFLISLRAGGTGLNLTAPISSSTTTRGGTLPRRIRPPTAPTASVSATRCRCIG